MKSLKKVLGIIFIVILALVLTRNIWVKMAVEAGARVVTGVPLKISKFKIGIFRTAVDIRDLKILNPKGYPEKVMLHMPEIYVHYNLPAILTGKIHLKEARINLSEFNVIKNKSGDLNLNSLKPVAGQMKSKDEKKKEPAGKPAEKMPDIHIDRLALKVGMVNYIDYSKGDEPKIKKFNVNLNEQHENIDNPNALVGLIVFKALATTTIGSLANVDLNGLQNVASGALDSAKDLTKDISEKASKASEQAKEALGSASDTLKETTKDLKGLMKNPFGN